MSKVWRGLPVFAATLALAATDAEPQAIDQAPVFIVGQDLDSIRGYLGSGCCPRPDGLTAYLSLRNLRAEAAGYGGIGVDLDGEPIALEHSWGAGPVNAYKTATAFGIDDLAIGLSLNDNDRPGMPEAVVAGEFDANVDRLRHLFAAVEGSVYLRVGYEFDGAWNGAYRNPAHYVAAYRHIADRVRGLADNVELVWQASASPIDDVLDGGHEDIERWYPGDAYVDWFALSWFMHPDARPSIPLEDLPLTPRELAGEVLAMARRAGKPVMIAEASPQGFDLAKSTRRELTPVWDGRAGNAPEAVTAEEIWEAWYAPLFALMDDNRDVVRALAYINCNWDAQAMWGPPYPSGYWGDSRLQANAALAERFGDAVTAWKSSFE